LRPSAHLELPKSRVKSTAKEQPVIWREGAHDIVAASPEGLQRILPFQRTPEVPYLASVVEGGCCKDVWRGVAESTDVDEVLVNVAPSAGDFACLYIEDPNGR